jgi:hypothetical protein
MLGHEVFDPEASRRVLVDHAFIVAGGEITKVAKNWLGNKLDATKRGQIMFMDRDDILNLYLVTNLPLPSGAILETAVSDDEIPFCVKQQIVVAGPGLVNAGEKTSSGFVE